jgi:hypothetical protein
MPTVRKRFVRIQKATNEGSWNRAPDPTNKVIRAFPGTYKSKQEIFTHTALKLRTAWPRHVRSRSASMRRNRITCNCPDRVITKALLGVSIRVLPPDFWFRVGMWRRWRIGSRVVYGSFAPLPALLDPFHHTLQGLNKLLERRWIWRVRWSCTRGRMCRNDVGTRLPYGLDRFVVGGFNGTDRFQSTDLNAAFMSPQYVIEQFFFDCALGGGSNHCAYFKCERSILVLSLLARSLICFAAQLTESFHLSLVLLVFPREVTVAPPRPCGGPIEMSSMNLYGMFVGVCLKITNKGKVVGEHDDLPELGFNDEAFCDGGLAHVVER